MLDVLLTGGIGSVEASILPVRVTIGTTEDTFETTLEDAEDEADDDVEELDPDELTFEVLNG